MKDAVSDVMTLIRKGKIGVPYNYDFVIGENVEDGISPFNTSFSAIGGSVGIIFVKKMSGEAYDVFRLESVSPSKIRVYVFPQAGVDVDSVKNAVVGLEIDEAHVIEKLSRVNIHVECYGVFGAYKRSICVTGACAVRRIEHELFLFVPLMGIGDGPKVYVKVAKISYLDGNHVVDPAVLKTVVAFGNSAFQVIEGRACFRSNDCRLTFKVKPQVYYAQYYAKGGSYLRQKISYVHKHIKAFLGKFFNSKPAKGEVK